MPKEYAPQKLTLKRVKAKALAAYKARKLAAQKRKTEERQCLYDAGNGCGCAIGVALSKAALKQVDELDLNPHYVTALVNKGVVSVDDAEYDAIRLIQSRHDDWANEMRVNGKGESARKTRKAFLEAIAA